MLEPASSIRMSYHRPVSMRPGTLWPTSPPISMACRVLPQPPMFHHDFWFSSWTRKRIRKPSAPPSLRAFRLKV